MRSWMASSVSAQTLNVATAGDQNMVDYIKDYLGPMFEKKYPGVKVRVERQWRHVRRSISRRKMRLQMTLAPVAIRNVAKPMASENSIATLAPTGMGRM